MAKIKLKIQLEPELELQAATLDAHQRRALARLYRRWARQLEVSAKMLELHAKPSPKRPLHPLPRRRLQWN